MVLFQDWVVPIGSTSVWAVDSNGAPYGGKIMLSQEADILGPV